MTEDPEYLTVTRINQAIDDLIEHQTTTDMHAKKNVVADMILDLWRLRVPKDVNSSEVNEIHKVFHNIMVICANKNGYYVELQPLVETLRLVAMNIDLADAFSGGGS